MHGMYNIKRNARYSQLNTVQLLSLVHQVFTRIGRDPHAAPILRAGWRVFTSAFWINHRVHSGTEWVQ